MKALAQVILVMAGPARADDACRMSGRGRALTLEVTPKGGGETFNVKLGDGANAILDLVPGRRPARAQALSGLSFYGTVGWEQIKLVPRDDTALGGGLVRLKDWHPMEAVEVLDDGRVRVRVLLAQGVTLTTEMWCRAVEVSFGWPAEKAADDGRRWWIAKASGDLELRSEPDGGERLTLSVSEPTQMRFTKVAARAGWLQVKAELPYKAIVSGWLPTASLRQWTAPRPPRRPRDEPGGFVVAGGSGEPSRKDGVWVGPARVRQGTRVYDAPGGHEWALVTLGEGALVQMKDGEDWAMLMAAWDLPYLCFKGETCRAWVPRSSVTPDPSRR